MTAAVALMLVAEGRIDLDSSVQRYLPEFRVHARGGGAAITVRQLLNQTSGLSDPGFPEMRMPQPKTLAERVTSLQTAVPEDEPGAAFHYFNSNYSLVARIVEVISGIPFEVVLERNLFTPLGMTGTKAVQTFALEEAEAPVPATGHVVAYGQAWRRHESGGFLSGHGGVVSTATDMGRWLQWQMIGQPNILRPEFLALMQNPPPPSSYAMGWFQHTANGETTIWHDGVFSTVFSDIVIKPERNVGLVLLYGVGGALPAATIFPKIRAGALAIANGIAPDAPGLSLVAVGRLTGAVTLILVIVALINLAALGRWRRWALSAPSWRVALGLASRPLPLVLLLLLPWELQLASGRAFSSEAVFFALLDGTFGLAIIGIILASSAILRLASLAQSVWWPGLADACNQP